MQNQQALVLEIFKQEKALKMSVYNQEEIASTLRLYSQCPVSFTEIRILCQEISEALNNIDKKGLLTCESFNSLKKAGQLLWEHLLSRSVKEKLKNTKSLNLILSIDEELINIPWELLHDGSNFLCLNFNLGRLVRTEEDTYAFQYRGYSSVPKMLILANPTNDLRSAYLEGVNIRNLFDRKRKNVRINFKSTSIDRLYVKKNLCDYDIVHFAGHCEHETENSKDSGWVLSDGRFTVEDILNLGSSVSLPSLIFSNACFSAKGMLDTIDSDYQKRHFNLASSFLLSGVRHYIGSLRKIEDPISQAFAKEFYSQLISGKSVGEAVKCGRMSLIKEYGIMTIAWASYLLYGDPNFILFRPKDKVRISISRIIINFSKKHIVKISVAAGIIAAALSAYLWLPSKNPNTYVLYLKSQNLFRKGDNQQVISLGSKILESDPLFIAIYPILADTYEKLGEKESALKYYFDYALYSERKKDLKHLAAAYTGIGWIYHLEGAYSKAADFYNKAIILSRKNKDKLNEAAALRKLAVWQIDKKDYSAALELLTKSSEINRERQYLYAFRYNLACDYFDIGLVFVNKDDFASAKEFYNKSRVIFEKLKLRNELSDCYFNLGEIYLFEKEYQKALDYYLSGLKIDRLQNNKMNLASDYNMIGELYLEMDNLKLAEGFFNKAIQASLQINARPELAAGYHNLGLLYKKMGKKNKSRDNLRQAQEIYKAIDESKYQEIKQEFLDLNS